MSTITNFFEKLFANDYFGVVLFCVIAFLILLFIIVLFFGLNDTKEKDEKKKETKKKEEEDAFLRIDDTVKLEIPKAEMASYNPDDEEVTLPEKKKDQEDK